VRLERFSYAYGAGKAAPMLRTHRPAIDTVLLDVDGTLVDSNDAHAHAWLGALAESGVTRTFASARPLIGMGQTSCCPVSRPILP